MQNTIQIMFLRKYNMYMTNDVAGFPSEMAEKLISDGTAKPFPNPKSLEARLKTKILTK